MCLEPSFLLTQVCLASDFALDCSFKLCQIFTPFFSLTVPSFAVFFRVLDRKFVRNSKNLLKTVISLRQVGFKRDFVPDCPFKLCF